MHPTFVLLRCYVIILRCYESAINFKGFLASLMSAVIPHSFIVFNIIFLRTHSLTSLLCVKPAETLPRGREGGGLREVWSLEFYCVGHSNLTLFGEKMVYDK